MQFRKLAFLATSALLLLGVAMSSAQDDTFRLTIMHTNDTHAGHAAGSNGNGGVALQMGVMNQIRAEGGNTLTLDAGDRFMGTLFHTVYEGADQVQVMNALGYDAMTLGNHEFDNGDQKLQDFLNGVNFPVVSANIDLSGVEGYGDLVLPYTIVEEGGQQIGIIGLTTAETTETSNPNDAITFSADYAAIANAAAAELMAQGVNKIILLTHIGITDDLALIPQLENIDVVLGGHSHTLLSNTYTGAADRYPVVLEDAAGNNVFYAQAGANNLYLGRLDVTFDVDGAVTAATGDTILLSRYITPDTVASDLVTELNGPVEELKAQPTGATTDILLDGDRRICRVEECNLGNIIADGMRAYAGTQIALMNSGGIRANIEAGDITLGEVLTVQPFGNTIATFELTGADLLAALENSVSRIALNETGQIERDGGSGRFLQVSGLRFSYDPALEAGSRIVSVEILQEDGSYAPLDEAAVYTAATNNFVRQGGDGFNMFAENATNVYDFGDVDYQVTINYLNTMTPLNMMVDADAPRITSVGVEVEPAS
jgi:5'-nucleotidase / UDP-sugar diphosphatase